MLIHRKGHGHGHLVHEPEGNGLVADERLVVALGVRDARLALLRAAVHQLPPEVMHRPVLVAHRFLKQLHRSRARAPSEHFTMLPDQIQISREHAVLYCTLYA